MDKKHKRVLALLWTAAVANGVWTWYVTKGKEMGT